MNRKGIQSAIKTLGKAMNQLEELVEQDQERLGDEDTLKNTRTFSDAENFDLPIPRLELRTYQNPQGALVVEYLVQRHYSGNIQAVCMGFCNVNGRLPLDGPYEPHRSGADIRYSAVTLKLSAYAVHENGQFHLMTSFQEYFMGPGKDNKPAKYIGEK